VVQIIKKSKTYIKIYIISNLLIAVSVFYLFAYTQIISNIDVSNMDESEIVKSKKNTIANSIFYLALSFLFGLISMSFFSFNGEWGGNFFFFLFLATIVALLINWFQFVVSNTDMGVIHHHQPYFIGLLLSLILAAILAFWLTSRSTLNK